MAQPSPDILQAPAHDEPSDAVLIEDSLRRPERFAVVFDRHYDAIHGYASRRLGRGLADDIASETFLIAFDRRARYDLGHADAAPWLYGIASNLLARHRRAEVRRYRAVARAGVRRGRRRPRRLRRRTPRRARLALTAGRRADRPGPP